MDQLFFSLKRAHHAALAVARPMLRPFELTPARFDIIVAVTLDSTQSGIGRLLGLTRSTISEMLTRLEQLGFIAREKLGRTRRVTLTAKGRAIFEKVQRACVDDQLAAHTITERLALGPHASVFHAIVASLTRLMRRGFGDGARSTIYGSSDLGPVGFCFAA